MSPVVVSACAKLNLGLEVLGRRSDGYHDIATIFQEISWCDSLKVSRSPNWTFQCTNPTLATPSNLAVTAAAKACEQLGVPQNFSVTLEKAIPEAAGLGGASADAAAVLLGIERESGRVLPSQTAQKIATSLGSDVPFFLTGGTAFATGRGELLDPLPSPDTRFVVIAPSIVLERKTQRLYELLETRDWSDGATIRTQAERLRASLPLDPVLCVNAFSRALARLAPETIEFRDLARAAGASNLSLSGAGPAHYVIEPDPDRAEAISQAFKAKLGSLAEVKVCTPVKRR